VRREVRKNVPVLEDDLGHPLQLQHPPTRLVSLVPSLTESLATSVPERLVGATDWCTRPEGLDIPRVRGTKNPDHRAIGRLAPDLVVANQEENRRTDVARLRTAGIPVWVTVTESVDEAMGSLRRLFVDVLSVEVPDWLSTATAAWRLPIAIPPARVVVPIWRDPWMVIGPRTFAGDLVARLGLHNVFAGSHDRYPKIGLPQILAEQPDLVMLPDEPYVFGVDDGPEAFPGVPTALVSGRSLTWYGPSMTTARAELTDGINLALQRG
jgi:ABC-type Fe3+-hydroxamate transport system substrate-binding protein